MALCSLRKAVATALGACAIMSFASMPSYAVDKDIYATGDGQNLAAKVQYEYKPDSMFTVYGKPGYLTDIELKPGEVPNYIGAGDTSRWMIDQADVDGVHHIYIKPLDNNLETNLIVNTDERCYRFIIVSSNDNYTPIVSFKFSAEEKAAEEAAYHERLLHYLEKPLTKEERLYRDIFFEKSKNIYVRKNLNNHYEVVRHGSIADELYPVKIFDDGSHTYFQMSSSNTNKMPVLYNIDDEKKPVLVNYRVKGPFFIADQIFENCRLQYSAKSYLDVRSLDIRKNHLLPGKVDYSKLDKGSLHEKIAELKAKRLAKESESDEDAVDIVSTPSSLVVHSSKTYASAQLAKEKNASVDVAKKVGSDSVEKKAVSIPADANKKSVEQTEVSKQSVEKVDSQQVVKSDASKQIQQVEKTNTSTSANVEKKDVAPQVEKKDVLPLVQQAVKNDVSQQSVKKDTVQKPVLTDSSVKVKNDTDKSKSKGQKLTDEERTTRVQNIIRRIRIHNIIHRIQKLVAKNQAETDTSKQTDNQIAK